MNKTKAVLGICVSILLISCIFYFKSFDQCRGKHIFYYDYDQGMPTDYHQLCYDGSKSKQLSLENTTFLAKTGSDLSGTKLLFQSEEYPPKRGGTSFFLKENGKSYLIATSTQNIAVIGPIISSDGKYIVFSTYHAYGDPQRQLPQTFYIYSVNDKKVIRQFDRALGNFSSYGLIGWSRDDKKLYVSLYNGVEAGYIAPGLHYISIESGEMLSDNSPETYVSTSLSPDSKKLAYIPYDSTNSHGNWTPTSPNMLVVMNLETKEKKSYPIHIQNPAYTYLKWSPDGTMIAYNTDSNLFLLNTESGQIRNLVKNVRIDGSIDWINNDHLVYQSWFENSRLGNADDTSILKMIKVDGTEDKELSKINSSAMYIVWTDF